MQFWNKLRRLTVSRGLVASKGLALVLVCTACSAFGQEAPPPDSSAAPALQEVTVTGSRIRRSTDFTAPTPTTVIDAVTMENLGIGNLGDTLDFTPSNVSTFTPANSGDAPYFIGAFIPDLRGLNPYFGSRTLTLVNSQRFVQSNQGDSVDLNLVPQILVERVDVVTGGASAAYGSGAIAGVYNVILNTKLEGFKFTADWGETSHSDARDAHIAAAWGGGLFDNRWHLVVGGELENHDGLHCQDARNFCHDNNGAYQTNLGDPGINTYGYGSNIRQNQLSLTGVFISGDPTALSTLQASPDGTRTVPFELGQQPYSTAPGSFGNNVIGGQGLPINLYTLLLAPVRRGVLTAMLGGAVTDNVNLQATVTWGKSDTNIDGQNVTSLGQYISPANAFLGNPGSDLSTAVGTGTFINKDWTAQAPLPSLFSTTTRRATLGVDGKFGASSWTWDGYYEYGLTNHEQEVLNNLHLNAANMAIDSVIDPATGKPTCYVTLHGVNPNDPHEQAAGYALADPAIAQGCIPLNPFGTQPIGPAAFAYSFGNLVENLRYQQNVIALNTQGNYFGGIGAGPFSAAFGYEFRNEKGDNIDNAGQSPASAIDYPTEYGVSFGGKVTVQEGYLETNLPLLKDLPGAHLLEVDLAGRESRYDNKASYGILINGNNPDFIHNLTTWKLSGSWEPTTWLRVRGSQSRDARAANFRELYYAQIIHAGGVFGYCAGPFVDPCNENLEGNVNLNPEKSDTTTIGIVLTPKDILNGLEFSADWFHITVNNAIEQASATLVLQGCAAGVATYCNQINFVPNTGGATAFQNGGLNAQTVTATSFNGAFYEVKGIDFSLNYQHDLGAWGAINARLLTTFMDQQLFQQYQGGPVFSILGQTGTGNTFFPDYTPAARWRGSLLPTYTKGPWSVTPSMNFVSRGTMDYLGVTPAAGLLYKEAVNPSQYGAAGAKVALLGLHPLPYNEVGSYFLFNLNASYHFLGDSAKGAVLFGQVNNVFNRKPPFTGGANAFSPAIGYGGSNPIFFDTLGLSYRVGVRVNF